MESHRIGVNVKWKLGSEIDEESVMAAICGE
jgi:hypothetical protein